MTLPKFDAAAETARLVEHIESDVHHRFRRRGAVVGVSGGIDSAVVLALCARAVGPERVLALLLPERESSPDSVELARDWADELGVPYVIEDISASLEGAGCYQRRDEVIKRLFPDFGEGWSSKVNLPGSILDEETLNVFYLTVLSPDGKERQKRLGPQDFRQIMAASNFKQRIRMAMLYYHAERQNYAVVGTGNRNEHELGFFVKYGDGGVDLAPIRHLLKSRVYLLAEELGVPDEIRMRTPTSDTYSAGSSQEEFFFRLSFDVLDGVWARWEAGSEPARIAAETGLEVEQVERILDDLKRKHRTTQYLRSPVVSYGDSEDGRGELAAASAAGAADST